MSCGLTEDVPSPVFCSVTTTSGRTPSQYAHMYSVHIHHIWLFPVHICISFFSSLPPLVLSPPLQSSFLEVSDNRSRSEPGAEDVVHCFLDLFTDHQVSIHLNKFLAILNLYCDCINKDS